MAFTQKEIEVDFDLSQGVFAGGGNTYTASGLRTSVKITNAGAPSMGSAEIAIFGLPLAVMNQLTTLGTQIDFTSKNRIVIRAGDAQSGLSIIFTGYISVAFADMQAMPECALRINAYATLWQGALPVSPTTQAGSTDVATLMGQIAQTMELAFENNGITSKIMNPYLPGTSRKQAEELARQAGIEIDMMCDTLAIWQPGLARQGDNILISSQTGMIGYPAYNGAGLVVTFLFDVRIKRGAAVTVQSDLTPACGNWYINNMEYEIESLMPKGKWFAILGLGKTKVAEVSGGD